MNKFLSYGLGAAAVVVVLVVGAQFVRSPNGLFGAEPTPTATPKPTATPEPAGLPAGPFLLLDSASGPSITVTLAAPGWNGTPGESFIEWSPLGAHGPTGAGIIGFSDSEYYVYGDPCAWSSTRPDTPATTVDGLMAALANQASREASTPEDITVDGHAGKSIILHMASDVADFDACDKGGSGDIFFGLFAVPPDVGFPARFSQDPGQIEEVWAVDVDGQLVVSIGVYYPETPQNAIDGMRAMLASATYELP